jgi:diacylglycerol kinase
MIKLLKSFGYAFKGIYFVLMEEQNMRIHVLAIAVVTIAGIFFELTALEWTVIALSIGGVIMAELMNTAIELLVDIVSPEFNKRAGEIKDISAAGVLVAAIVATVVAVYVFGNKIFNLLL